MRNLSVKIRNTLTCSARNQASTSKTRSSSINWPSNTRNSANSTPPWLKYNKNTRYNFSSTPTSSAISPKKSKNSFPRQSNLSGKYNNKKERRRMRAAILYWNWLPKRTVRYSNWRKDSMAWAKADRSKTTVSWTNRSWI